MRAVIKFGYEAILGVLAIAGILFIVEAIYEESYGHCSIGEWRLNDGRKFLTVYKDNTAVMGSTYGYPCTWQSKDNKTAVVVCELSRDAKSADILSCTEGGVGHFNEQIIYRKEN